MAKKDSNTSTQIRRITYRLYPTKRQQETLLEWLYQHCRLYNASLQERKDAYKWAHKSLQYIDQQNELPGVKIENPELIPLGAHALQATLRRVDRAYQAFFRRCKQRVRRKGFPRFKSVERYRSFTYPDHQRWKLLPKKLHLANIGQVKLRGKARTEGNPTTCTILRKADKWYASITINCEPKRESFGTEYVGIDPGLEKLLTFSNGITIENPRHLKQVQSKLKSAQRSLSRKKRGSKRREKQRKIVARLHEKVANTRSEYLHKLSSSLVESLAGIAIEKNHVANMTRNGGAHKKGLNRSMGDAGLGYLYRMLAYKSGEAGTVYLEIDPRGHAPSQTCCICGNRKSMPMSERVYRCDVCGNVMPRDINSSHNLFEIGFGSGTGPGVEGSASVFGQVGPMKRETLLLH